MSSRMLRNLAEQFVERAERFGIKGKKRDEAAVEFFTGAYAALYNSNHPDAQHVGTVTQLLICTRGYSEVKALAEPVPPETKLKVHPSGSVECPHCHWGFAPSVIDQHILEKH